MVSLATSELMPQVAALWKLGFGDGEEYTGFVFKHLLTPDKVLLAKDKTGQPVAMLCMEPMELIRGRESKKGLYLYAFTTHPRARGTGVGTQLLEGFHKHCKKEGYAASVLTPATPELFTYYGDRGYANQFGVILDERAPERFTKPEKPCVLVGRSLDMLYNRRREFFGQNGLFVEWSPHYLAFVDKETRLRKGEVLSVACGEHKGYLVYRKEEEQVIITELGVPAPIVEETLYTLHQRVGGKSYSIRFKGDTEVKGLQNPVLPFAMIRWYDKGKVTTILEQASYISHVMD